MKVVISKKEQEINKEDLIFIQKLLEPYGFNVMEYEKFVKRKKEKIEGMNDVIDDYLKDILTLNFFRSQLYTKFPEYIEHIKNLMDEVDFSELEMSKLRKLIDYMEKNL